MFIISQCNYNIERRRISSAESNFAKKNYGKTTRATALPTKEFTAQTTKLGDYIYGHGTSDASSPKASRRPRHSLSNQVKMMTSTMTRSKATLMILLIESDLKEPQGTPKAGLEECQVSEETSCPDY